MKNRRGTCLKLGVTFACVAIVASVATAAIASNSSISASPISASQLNPGAAALKKLPYAPGRLIVKLKPSVKACIDCRLNAGKPLAPVLGSRRLDKLNRLYGLRGAKSLNPANRKIKSTNKRRARERRLLRRLVRKSKRRAKRTSPRKLNRAPSLASTYVLKLSPWLDMKKVAREYEKDPKVAYAEPDAKMKASYVPNDPHFGLDKHSWGQSFPDLWGLYNIDAPQAWDATKGENVVVAVSDTGVDMNHVDMVDRSFNPQYNQLWKNTGEDTYGSNGKDDDHNGFIDDLHGYDFVQGDGNPTDMNGHGTHVAGTIAAAADNQNAIVGVAFKSKIMAVRGLDANGSGYVSDLANGITYAAQNGADVINASWGGGGGGDTLNDVIGQANAAGTTFVAAAGNSNLDVTESPYGVFYPAASPGAITVAATDHNDEKASFSNFGAKIDVAAPGGGDSEPTSAYEPQSSVLSLKANNSNWDYRLIPGGQYGCCVRLAGTSMAAPHVTGTAALIMSAHPGYTPSQVRQALRVGADDIGDPGFDTKYGYGRINAARSVGLDVPSVEISSPQSGYTTAGDQIALDGTAKGDAPSFDAYYLEYGSGNDPSSWSPIAGPISTQVDGGQLGLWDTTNVPEGDYIVRVRVRNDVGTDFDIRIKVTIDRTSISSPQPRSIQRATGSLEVHGTARGADLQSFGVEWRRTTPDYQTSSWSNAGVSLAGGGGSPVQDGLLATIDTNQFGGNANLDIRLATQRSGDDVSQELLGVIADPSLRAGWPKKVPGLPSAYLPDILPNLSFSIMHHSTIADLDQDGTKEILVAYGDMVYVYRHDGSLAPGWPQIMSASDGLPAFARNSPAAADLDGDGKLEVVTANASPAGRWASDGGNTYAWHDDGTPLDGWPKRIQYPYEGWFGAPYSFPGGPRGDFVLSDVDNDGYRDIVAVVGPKLVVLDRNGNPLPGWPIGNAALLDYGFTDLVAVGDTDGDGTKEIATVGLKFGTSKTSELTLWSSTGQKMAGFPKTLPGLTYGLPRFRFTGLNAGPVMADFNGDGKLDISVMMSKLRMYTVDGKGNAIKLGPANGKGTKNKACGRSIPATLEQATAADLNGDGIAEVLAASHVTSWSWHRWYGQPVLSAWCKENTTGPDYINTFGTKKIDGWPQKIDYPSGDNTAGPGSAAVGDIDGDLQPDVVSASGICGMWDKSLGPNGRRCFTVNAYSAQGQLLPGFPKATPSGAPTAGMNPAIGDLDGDGRKEITTVDGDGNLMVWDVPGPSAPEKMQWPMFRGNSAHTGVLTPTP